MTDDYAATTEAVSEREMRFAYLCAGCGPIDVTAPDGTCPYCGASSEDIAQRILPPIPDMAGTEPRLTYDRDDFERLKALFIRARVVVLCQPYMEMTPQAARLQVDREMVNLLTLYASQPPNPVTPSVEAAKPSDEQVGVTDASAAEIMDAFAELRCAMTHEQESASISRVIAAVRADELQKHTWQDIATAPKHVPLLFLFDEGDGQYFQEVGQRLEDAPNGGRMRFAEANMNPGNEPEETTRPSFWMLLPAPLKSDPLSRGDDRGNS